MTDVTFIIDNLVKRELVERTRDSEDRRFVTVSLTAAGEELIGEVFPRHAAIITEDLGILTDREQELLAQLCRKIGLRLEGEAISELPAQEED